MIRGRLLFALVTTFALAACTGGGGDGDGDKGGGKDGPKGPNFGIVIDTKSCMNPMENHFDDANFFEEELARAITFGDAPCAKKAIELGQLDPNQKLEPTGLGDIDYPIFLAMDGTSLRFAKSKSESFSLIKVLVDAGASLLQQNSNNDTALLNAVKDRDVTEYPEVAQYLIQTGQSYPEEYDSNNKAAIHYIIGLKHIGSLDMLEKHGSNLDLQDGSRNHPLLMAIDANWSEGATSLVDAGADVLIRNKNNETPLHRALQMGINAVAKKIVPKMKIEILNEQDSNLKSHLAVAVEKRNVEMTKILLGKNVNVNTRDSQSRTPLHLAMKWGEQKIGQTIIQRTNSSYIDQLNNDGQTALLIATDGKNANFVQWLLGARAGVDIGHQQSNERPLHVATRLNWTQGMAILIAGNAKVNIQDGKGNTPLHMATTPGAVQTLLAENANKELANNDGQTPIVSAMLSDNEAVFMALANANAAVNWTGEKRKTLLHFAVEQNMANATDHLLNKLDYNAQDAELKTPLFKARGMNVLNKILGKSPALETRDENGYTAFDSYVKTYLFSENPERLSMIKRMIEVGADVNNVNNNQNTIIFEVVKFQRRLEEKPVYYGDLMAAFAKSDMDYNAKDSNGFTPLFKVDTVQEVRDLKRGTTIGGVDPDYATGSGLTASEAFARTIGRLDSEIGDLDKRIADIEKDIEAAEADENQVAINQLTALKRGLVNQRSGKLAKKSNLKLVMDEI